MTTRTGGFTMTAFSSDAPTLEPPRFVQHAPLLAATEINKRYGSVTALEEVSVTLYPREVLGIVGESGSGKSTLLHTLYRSYRAPSGHLRYGSLHGRLDLVSAADVDVMLLRQQEIGFVTQFLRPRPRVSAVELVAEPLLFSGTPHKVALERASQALELFGLKPELWQAYPTTFSGGEQQKVNLARALIQSRRLLLLDEPTASLDAQARVALRERLAQLKNDGVAMIGVLHHPEDVARLLEREINLTTDATLNEGFRVADGTGLNEPEESAYVA